MVVVGSEVVRAVEAMADCRQRRYKLLLRRLVLQCALNSHGRAQQAAESRWGAPGRWRLWRRGWGRRLRWAAGRQATRECMSTAAQGGGCWRAGRHQAAGCGCNTHTQSVASGKPPSGAHLGGGGLGGGAGGGGAGGGEGGGGIEGGSKEGMFATLVWQFEPK